MSNPLVDMFTLHQNVQPPITAPRSWGPNGLTTYPTSPPPPVTDPGVVFVPSVQSPFDHGHNPLWNYHMATIGLGSTPEHYGLPFPAPHKPVVYNGPSALASLYAGP